MFTLMHLWVGCWHRLFSTRTRSVYWRNWRRTVSFSQFALTSMTTCAFTLTSRTNCADPEYHSTGREYLPAVFSILVVRTQSPAGFHSSYLIRELFTPGMPGEPNYIPSRIENQQHCGPWGPGLPLPLNMSLKRTSTWPTWCHNDPRCGVLAGDVPRCVRVGRHVEMEV